MGSSRAQDAFERARKTYIELLTAKERARIETPTSVSDLQLQAQSISAAFEANRTRRTSRFFRGLGDAANMLQPFERLIEGVCNLSPHGGDLIWCSVSFLFEMARNNVEVFDEILDFFLTMAQEMDYVQLLEDAFDEAPLVMSVIEELYVAIIDFWVKAIKYYRPKPSKRARIFSELSNFLSSNYMAQKFQGLKDAITAQKLRLHHVASAQHLADSALHHRETKRQLHTARQTQLIAWIDAPSYENDFNAADKHHYPGTCEWIRHKTEYIGWEERKADSFLVIYGIPGAGKTILSSWLINQARSHSRALEDHVVLYHYFKAGDVTKSTPEAAMRSLLEQFYEHLRRRMHNLIQELEASLATRSTKVHVSFADLWAIFSPLVLQFSELQATFPAVTVVLDAMDECKGSKPLVRELQKLVHAAAGAIKVIVTARKSGDHVNEFVRSSLHKPLFLEISRDDVKHDIASFTQYKINKIERLRGPHLETLRSTVIAELGKAENHQGMFLWTYLMCKEVKRQLQVSAIWRLLQNLPRGLDAMYARICKGLAENDQHRDFGQSVLQWIVASSRPLRFGELEQALKTMQTQSSKTAEFFDDNLYDDDYGLGLLWSRKDIVDACGDLVTYTGLEEGDMVGLIHLSARQFLRSDPTQLHLPPDLQPSLASISPFLVDVSRAECAMGATCIDFLLSGSLHSDSYFARPIDSSGVPGDSLKDAFLKRHPFFRYAVEYWPEYLLDVLKAISGEPETRRLVTKVAAFAAHTFSSTWLEEYIRQSGTEFTLYTAQRLSAAPSSVVPSDFLLWANRVGQVVENYTQTLSRKPQLVRLCLQQSPTADFTSHSRSQIVLSFRLDTEDDAVKGMSSTPPLEKSSRGWLHYDSTSDSLFAVDRSTDGIRLKRQVMKTGMRLRPSSEGGDTSAHNGSTYILRSAAVSARAGFIAVTFLPAGGAERLYRTVCWSLISSATLSSASEWAEVAFVDRVDTPRSDIFANREYSVARANLVAFGKNNTLITPAGIWNLLTEELVDGPSSIFDPDPELRVTNTCFSGRGERVARVIRSSTRNVIEMEVLDISGVSLWRKGFLEASHSNELNLLNFSHSGEKIVLAKQFTQHPPPGQLPGRISSRKLTFSFVCFLVNDLKGIVLSTPYPLSGLKYPQFSGDETKLIAAIDGGLGGSTDDTASSGFSIVVWSLAIDERGNQPEHASMVYLFKMWEPDFTFCMAPPRRGLAAEEVIIVNKAGIITRRSTDTVWTSDDDEELLELSRDILLASEGATLSVLENGDALGLMMCSGSSDESPLVALDMWSLRSPGPKLSFSLRHHLLASDTCFNYYLSGSGHYMIAKSQVFHVSPGGLRALAFPFGADQFVNADVNADETQIACIYADGCHCMLSIFDIFADVQVHLRASRTIAQIPDPVDPDFIAQPLQFEIIFDRHRTDFLIITYDNAMESSQTCIVRLKEDNLIAAEMNGDFLPALTFSTCGGYIYSGIQYYSEDIQWPKLYSLPDSGLISSTPPSPPHPVALLVDCYYVCAPHIFRLRGEGRTGVMFLDHKLISEDDETYRSRIICVKPDGFLWRPGMQTVLIWPHDLEGEATGVNHDVKIVIASEGGPTVIDTGIKSGEMMREDDWFIHR